MTEPRVPLLLRVLIAGVIGLASGGLVLGGVLGGTDMRSDIDQALMAASALRAGLNPYEVVGPGLAYHIPWPFFYPLPAALLLTPLAPLPLVAARATFVAISSSMLAFALTRSSLHRLTLFTSAAFLMSATLAQWSPLLVAGVLLPPLGFVLAAKPNIAIALLAAYPSRAAIGGIVLLGIVSIAVLPTWPAMWLEITGEAAHVRAPVTHLGGPLLLLALLRWRRPEARLLAALSLVPHTMGLYETLSLFLIAATWRQSLLLSLLTYLTFFAIFLPGPFDSFAAYDRASGQLIVLLLYFPALILVLRRPNEGAVPAPIERLFARVTAAQARIVAALPFPKRGRETG